MKLFAALTALVLLPSFAVAQEKTQEQQREEQAVIFQHDGVQRHAYKRIVASGAKTRVGYWGSVNPDCSSKGDTVIRVTNEPEHGTVEVGNFSGSSITRGNKTDFFDARGRYSGTTTQQGTASNPLRGVDGSNPFGRKR